MDQTFITHCIQTNTPLVFLKYGDGEYECASKYDQGQAVAKHTHANNCDHDTYTVRLSNALKESFVYMVENGQNYLFGKWGTTVVVNYWESLVPDKQVKWVMYHMILWYDMNPEVLNIYRAVKTSQLSKIFVCNDLLAKAQMLLNIDHMVYVPKNSWFDTQFDDVLQRIVNIIEATKAEGYVIMTSCGMSAKAAV